MTFKTFFYKCSSIAKLERLIAIISILIPLILIIADKGHSVRNSISAYVDMENSHVFGALITIAAMMFIFNGFLFIRNFKSSMDEKGHSRWYNIVLGMALLGVVFFHFEEMPILHYFSAGVFFYGSAIVIAFFNCKKFHKISWFIALLSVSGLTICFINKFLDIDIPYTSWLSIFIAEWISLGVIAIHYILESLGVVSK